jgi:predicted small metal-binding protein
MRALLCSCKHRLTASNDEELFRAVVNHVDEYHPVMALSEDRIREVVAAHSYEYNEVTLVGADPEEEFGIDPY